VDCYIDYSKEGNKQWKNLLTIIERKKWNIFFLISVKMLDKYLKKLYN
jgi:hypothetical protein